jgi:hypothetical protein
MLGAMTERLRGIALAASLSVLGCTSDHHVSEWGDLGRPDLMLYVEKPDIATHLAEIDNDADLRGLSRDHELAANVKGTPYVARSFIGTGQLGRTLHAIRVATPSGVILALGPIATSDNLRREPCELVVSVSGPPPDGGGPFMSMMDFLGTGFPSVIVKDEDGRLAIFTLNPHGAVKVETDFEVVPTEVSDIDSDGHLDLRGHVKMDDDDPIHPDFVDVATFDGRRFSNKTQPARAFHSMLRDERNDDPPSTDATVRARRALERAWHAALAGDDAKKTLEKLDQEKPAKALASAFAFHRARIEKISNPHP